MKALLRKDMTVLWRRMKIFFLLILVFSAVPSAFQNTFAVVYAAMLPYSIFSVDEASKWDTLSMMLPYSTKEIVGSKYLLGGVFIAFTALLMWVFRLVHPLLGIPVAEDMTLMATCISLLVMDLTLPAVFRFGVEKARMTMIFLIAAVCGSAGAASALVEKGIRLGSGLVPLIISAVVGTVISVRVSMAMWEKRKA